MAGDTILQACKDYFAPNQSNCSGFVRAVATSLGLTIFNKDPDSEFEMNADAITGYIKQSWPACENWYEAESFAKYGFLVVGGLKASEHATPKNNGHVVIVASDTVWIENQWKQRSIAAWCGSIGGAASKGVLGIYGIWGTKDANKVRFHYYPDEVYS